MLPAIVAVSRRFAAVGWHLGLAAAWRTAIACPVRLSTSPPRPNPRRVVIEVQVERTLGSSDLLDHGE